MYNQNNITITDAVYEDVVDLVPILKEADVSELKALGQEPMDALTESFKASVQVYTVKVYGKVIAMFGLNPVDLLGNKAMIWFVSSDDLTFISKRFLRNSRKFIAEALEQYDLLYNWVDVRNEKAVQWLAWLGAHLDMPTAYGVNGEKFYYFTFSNTKEVVKVLDDKVEIAPRKKIAIMEQALMNHPNAIVVGDENEPPLKHEFTDGMYTRTIKLPKGMILTGKIHKHDHPNFLMEGKVEVYTEHNGTEILTAPQIIMSKAGTKRVVLTLEDTVWATVHANPTNTQDLGTLENILMAKSYEEIEHNSQEVLQ